MPDLPLRRSRTARAAAFLTLPLGKAQHRNAAFLLLNTVVGAAAGLLFWLLLARVLRLPPAEVGIGYAVVALGTTVAVVAKGGLDTALLRAVPRASRADAGRLLAFAAAIGGCLALAATAVVAAGAWAVGGLQGLSVSSWALVAAIGALLVVTWLQDAYFLAEGDARNSFARNLVLSTVRLLLPLPLVLLAVAQPVAVSWALALAASAAVAVLLHRRIPDRSGEPVSRRAFLRNAVRNVSGGAAEFLPGLLLVPFVLALEGPDAAAYFGIAWTAASLLFVASAAVGRSALAEMVRRPDESADAVRRGVLQNAILVGPPALAGVLLAPFVLSVFGPAYAAAGATAFAILCASAFVVAPAYLYLAVLRARDRPWALVVFPAAMVLALAAFTPILEARWGLPGVASAWLLANAPFGAWAAWRLVRDREVTDAAPVGGRAHLE